MAGVAMICQVRIVDARVTGVTIVTCGTEVVDIGTLRGSGPVRNLSNCFVFGRPRSETAGELSPGQVARRALWEGAPMTTIADADLEALVGDWLTVPDLADRLRLRLADARTLLEDGYLLGAKVGPRRILKVPAAFIDEEGPLPALKGTFTVLADSGLDESEVLAWLFTPDATLPVEGAPINSLRAGHKTEIRRRAMELAF